MADLKTTQLTELAARPASNDLLTLVDVSDTTMSAGGTNKKITAVRFAHTDNNATLISGGGTVALGGNALTVTGGGTVALGGNNLTVPSSGTAAIRQASNTFTVAQAFSSNVTVSGALVLGPGTTLVVTGGAITVTGSLHFIDTENNDPTDTLNTIYGASAIGHVLILRSVSALRDITLLDGVGNLALSGDRVLDNAQDTIILVWTGSAWNELSFANNA